MTSTPIERLYATIVSAGKGIDDTLARQLFDAALRNGDLAAAAAVAALPGLPDDITERARTHRNAQVRAGWLTSTDRTDDEVNAALSDKAASTFKEIAKTSREQSLLVRLAVRPGAELDKLLLNNPATPAATMKDLLARCAQRPRFNSPNLDIAARFEGRPDAHEMYVLMCLDRHWFYNRPLENLCGSPMLSEATVLKVVDAVMLMPMDDGSSASRRAQAIGMVRGLSLNPALTAKGVAAVKRAERYVGSNQLGTVGVGTSRARQLADPSTSLAELEFAASQLSPDGRSPGDAWIPDVIFTHPNVSEALRLQVACRVQFATIREAVQMAWWSDRALAGRLATQNDRLLWEGRRSGCPVGISETEMRRAALLAGLGDPSLIWAKSWVSLLGMVRSRHEFAQLPVEVLAHSSSLPADVIAEAADWLAAELGTTHAYEALRALGDGCGQRIGELVEAVTLLAMA